MQFKERMQLPNMRLQPTSAVNAFSVSILAAYPPPR